MDSLTLLEKSYKKSRFNVGGEWHDKFRWCYGGDGGGDGGDAAADFDAMNAQAAAEQQGFAEFAGAQTGEQAAAEQQGFESAVQDAFSSGVIGEQDLDALGFEQDPTGQQTLAIQAKGPTATFADVRNTVADLLDPTPLSLLTNVLAPGIGPVARTAISLGANALAKETGAAQAVQGATGINPAEGIIGQAAQQAGVVGSAPSPAPSELSAAQQNTQYGGIGSQQYSGGVGVSPDVPSYNFNKGGVVPLRRGIGSLFGKR
jgi:hypothetical protein